MVAVGKQQQQYEQYCISTGIAHHLSVKAISKGPHICLAHKFLAPLGSLHARGNSSGGTIYLVGYRFDNFGLHQSVLLTF